MIGIIATCLILKYSDIVLQIQDFFSNVTLYLKIHISFTRK
jgi:hypothetical protein